MGIEGVDVERLSCAAVDTKPIEWDWSEGYGDTWETVRPDIPDTVAGCRDLIRELERDTAGDPNPWVMDRVQLLAALADAGEDAGESDTDDQLRSRLVEMMDDEAIDGLDSWQDAAGEAIDQADGDGGFTPVMNYAYPVPDLKDGADAQRTLLGHCLTVVTISDSPYLALTGGGMDLSWEICEAYVLLGYLPPLHFCDLPRMCDRGRSARDRVILAACKRTCDVVRGWVERRRAELDSY